MKKLNEKEIRFLSQCNELKKKYPNIYINIKCITVILFFIPIIIWISYFIGDRGYVLIYTSLGIGDALGFYGSFLTFIGTLFLGILALWQNKKANEINMHLLTITEKSTELENQKYMSFIQVERVKIDAVDDIIKLTIEYKNSGEVPIYRIRVLQDPPDICLQDKNGKNLKYIYASTVKMDSAENKILSIGDITGITIDIPKDAKNPKKGIVYLKTEIKSVYSLKRYELLLIEFLIEEENKASLIGRSEYFYKNEEELNEKYKKILSATII